MEKPFLVPPTWNKARYHRPLESIWRAAAAELGDSREIIVIGYSLPVTDQFFQYLYALGTMGPSILKKFTLVDVDENIWPKYVDNLLSDTMAKKSVFIHKGFSDSIAELRNSFGLGKKGPKSYIGSF